MRMTPLLDSHPTAHTGMPNSVTRAGKIGFSLLLVSLLAVGMVTLDWWSCLPADAVAEYVGGSNCVECHQAESELWHDSHHDLAMDRATPATVLGDFNDATLDHHGITSRMYQDGERFLVSTEGPDGNISEFEVKYVFGVEPLQQYMVEFDRTAGMPDSELARVQVLRLSWNTKQKKWFYLAPPDVDEKLAPDDPLHWTGSAQNWNHMCADCHSTNLKKNFDVATASYHTTFSDMDVSCEACHGPGSLHVKLASAKSLFWDRKRNYGLSQLKTASSQPQLHACAPCHSRRSVIAEEYHGGDNYYNHYANELLTPETYYCDGQALDEVYVFGSFLQSKMYREGVRCTDCHNPHTTKVKFTDNRLCTSCHAHDPAKYDTPAHHRHNVGSKGSLCIECHMPESPFMDVDLRRDHSMQIPRPDLSVELGTPNACTGCHLEDRTLAPHTTLPEEKQDDLRFYANWMRAARDGDSEVELEINRVNAWAAKTVLEWYGPRSSGTDNAKQRVDFAKTLHSGWQAAPDAGISLANLARNRRAAPIVRASALNQLGRYRPKLRLDVSLKQLKDSDPQVRAAAVRNLADLPRGDLIRYCAPLLDDSVRSVQIEAALTLADLSQGAFTPLQRNKFQAALESYRQAMLRNSDQASAHMALGILAERQQDIPAAVQAYETAIRVQPSVTGPRGNLAAIFERQRRVPEALKLRSEELVLLGRDARLAPEVASVQYRFGLSAYLAGNLGDAEVALSKAAELEPNTADFSLALALLYQKLERYSDALPYAQRVVKLQPANTGYRNVLQEIEAQIRVKQP